MSFLPVPYLSQRQDDQVAKMVSTGNYVPAMHSYKQLKDDSPTQGTRFNPQTWKDLLLLLSSTELAWPTDQTVFNLKHEMHLLWEPKWIYHETQPLLFMTPKSHVREKGVFLALSRGSSQESSVRGSGVKSSLWPTASARGKEAGPRSHTEELTYGFGVWFYDFIT